MTLPAVRAAVLYFGVVFATGFVLGAIRTLLLVPRLGVRVSELLEMPWMLLASYLAARWVVARSGLAARAGACLAVGVGALALLVAAEAGLVTRLRGVTLADEIAGRDPVSGVAYLISLLLFAAMPLFAQQRLK